MSSSSGLIIDATFDSFEIQLAEYKKKHSNYHTTLSPSPRKLSTKTSILGMNLSTNCKSRINVQVEDYWNKHVQVFKKLQPFRRSNLNCSNSMPFKRPRKDISRSEPRNAKKQPVKPWVVFSMGVCEPYFHQCGKNASIGLEKLPKVCLRGNEILNTSVTYSIPIHITHSLSTNLSCLLGTVGRKCNPSNLTPISCTAFSEIPSVHNLSAAKKENFGNNEFGMGLLLANTMSLAPKMDEIRSLAIHLKPDLACFTETWLQDSTSTNYLHISGYNFISRNRTTGVHGGVCLYIKNSCQFKNSRSPTRPRYGSSVGVA